MKALTFHQPWASIVIAGAKPFEFRRWCAPSWMIGERFAVHAASRPIPAGELAELRSYDVLAASVVGGRLGPALDIVDQEWRRAGSLPLGAVLGTAVLGRPRRAVDIMPPGSDLSQVDPDCWAWPISDVQRFKTPIPAKGGRQFWNWGGQP